MRVGGVNEYLSRPEAGSDDARMTRVRFAAAEGGRRWLKCDAREARLAQNAQK